MFHHFHGNGHVPGQGSISAKQFDAMIRWLGRENFLPADQWMEKANSGRLRKEDLCITFDDNLRCQFDVALNVLRAHKLTGFWFVYTSVLEGRLERLELYRAYRTRYFASVEEFYSRFFQFVSGGKWGKEIAAGLRGFDATNYLAGFPFYTSEDRRLRFVRDEILKPDKYHEVMDRMIAESGVSLTDLAGGLWMDEECLRELHREGHVIGLHSHTHPTRVAELDRAGQHAEYTSNCEQLTRVLGVRPLAMSHPCNSYSAVTLDVLRGLGVRLGFRANMVAGFGGELERPREDHANILAAMRKEKVA